jgi:integrase/recombinase XerD
MNEKKDLYNQDKRFISALSDLNSWNTSDKNKNFIKKFISICGAENMSLIRRVRYIGFLKIICKILKKDFDKVTKEDIIILVGEINSMNYAPSTKKGFKITIKKFYSTLFYDTDKEFVDWMYEKRNRVLKATIKKSEQRKKSVVLTKEDVSRLISAAEPRMKALISLAFEGCLRPAEYLLAKIKDIEPIEHGFRLNVEGKTGERPIFLIESAPYISRWLEIHPCKDNKESYLFVTIALNNKGNLFGIRGVDKQYKKLFREIDLDKKATLYHLRHSGIMFKRQNNVPDDILEQYCGWVPGSSAKKFYYRQAGEETKSRIYQLNGIKQVKKEENGEKVCFRCSEKNGFADKLCSKCGTPLNKEVFDKMQSKQIFYEKLIEKLVETVDYSKFAEDKEKYQKFGKTYVRKDIPNLLKKQYFSPGSNSDSMKGQDT